MGGNVGGSGGSITPSKLDLDRELEIDDIDMDDEDDDLVEDKMAMDEAELRAIERMGLLEEVEDDSVPTFYPCEKQGPFSSHGQLVPWQRRVDRSCSIKWSYKIVQTANQRT